LKPFFSVVIPTYNRAAALGLTLESVLAQTFADFEVLVMDDGSTDGTEAAVATYRDPRIRYEWATNSGGPATPRNRGIDAARADWICFLDADDRWHHDKLKTVAGVIGSNAYSDLICHNEITTVLATGSRTPLQHGPYEPGFYKVMLISGNRVSTSAATVRRSFLAMHGLRFNQSPDYVIVEDYDMWLRIALHGGVFHFISEYLGEYVIADDNISSNSQRIQRNHSVLLHDHVFGVQTFRADKERLWREINAGLLVSRAKAQVAKKQYCAGASLIAQALRHSFVGSTKYIFLQTFKKRSVPQQGTLGKY